MPNIYNLDKSLSEENWSSYFLLVDLLSCFKGKKGSIAACVSPLTSLMMDQRISSHQRVLKQSLWGKTNIMMMIPIKRALRGKFQIGSISPQSLTANVQY